MLGGKNCEEMICRLRVTRAVIGMQKRARSIRTSVQREMARKTVYIPCQCKRQRLDTCKLALKFHRLCMPAQSPVVAGSNTYFRLASS